MCKVWSFSQAKNKPLSVYWSCQILYQWVVYQETRTFSWIQLMGLSSRGVNPGKDLLESPLFWKATSNGQDQPMNNHPPELLSVGTRCGGVSGQDLAVWYVSFWLCARAVKSWCYLWLKKPVHCRSNFYFLFQTLIVSPMGNNKVAPNYYSHNISCLMGRVHRKPSKPWLQTRLMASHILNWAYLGLSPGHETAEDFVALMDKVLL